MNLDRDGVDDDIISRESPLDLEGNYKKVRGGALLFINNWTIFLTGRKVAKFHTQWSLPLYTEEKLNAQN